MSGKISRRHVVAGGIVSATAFAALSSFGPADAQDEPKGLRVIAELVAKPGSADDLRNVLVPFAQGARKEPGCLKYVLLEVQGEPGRFMTYEVWSDRPALDAHMKTPAIQAAGPKLAPLLVKPFTQIFLDLAT